MAKESGYQRVPIQLGHVSTYDDTNSAVHQDDTKTYYTPKAKHSTRASAPMGLENPRADEKALGPRIPSIPGKAAQWPGRPVKGTVKAPGGPTHTNANVDADYEEGTCV